MMWTGLWPFLYAETHYRLPLLFNRLFKKEPEILADLPFRVSKNSELPILILVKDAHRFPVHLIAIDVYVDAQHLERRTLNTTVKQKSKEWLLEFDISRFNTGWHQIQVKISYQVNNQFKSCFADNYKGTSHRPFHCYFTREPWPLKQGFFAGDLHSHSHFTDDQIEFGASLKAMQRMASAIELDFFCVTDHSYDLDDAIDNYLKQDPTLPKWRQFLNETELLNKARLPAAPVIVPGEEVSTRNAKNQTVHLLVLNHPNFIPGSGDSGEKIWSRQSEWHIAQVLQEAQSQTLTLPAHPAQHVPFAQRLFINRGNWQTSDLLQHRFDGVQIVNGGDAQSISKAIRLWKLLLLNGKKVFPAAGNDAHGHFNRVREIAIPFVSIREHDHHVFGRWRTILHCPTPPRQPVQIVQCFKKGRLLISNGPFVELIGFNGKQSVYMGQSAPAINHVSILALSSEEFGPLLNIKLIAGFVKQKEEKVWWEQNFMQPSMTFKRKFSLALNPLPDYIRAEAKSQFGLAFSNCIWIDH